MTEYARDPTAELELAAEFYGLRNTDKLIAAGVTATDLKELADQGQPEGTCRPRAARRLAVLQGCRTGERTYASQRASSGR